MNTKAFFEHMNYWKKFIFYRGIYEKKNFSN